MKFKKIRKTLSFQLLKSIFGLYFVLAILVTFFQIYLEYKNTERNIQNELDRISWTFNSSLTNALYDLDEDLVKLILVGTTKNSVVVGGKILDEKNQIIHSVGGTDFKNNKSFFEKRIKIEKNIVMEREGVTFHLGKLILFSDNKVIFERIRYGVFLIIISSIVKTTLLCLVLVFFLRKYLSIPLSKMTNELDNLDQKHLRLIENLPSSDNIGEILNLKESFNSLIMRLRQSNMEIENYKDHLEDTIKVRTRALERALSVKSQFLANVSHEIRTPLHAIMGMVEQLGDTKLDNDQKEMLEIVKGSSSGLLGIVNDILDFNSVEKSELKIINTTTNLKILIQNIATLYKMDCDKKGLHLIISISESFPDSVSIDAIRVKQILNNLISNAIKFTNEGEIEISLNNRKKQQGNEIVISVRDTGIGISQNNKKKLFNIFTQEDGSLTRKHGGMGIGLSVVSKLVHLMGGRIHFDSEKGSGTEFFVIFPIVEEEILEKNIDHNLSEDLSSKFSVLIVEDNLVNQKLAKKMLDKLNIRFEIADNGQNAIELALKNSYTHILMDIQMPVLDGVSATKKIISELGQKSPIILALTANAFNEDRQKCLEAGMKGFLTKPLGMNELKIALTESYNNEMKKVS
ncbi:MAG: response regulator [Halobacteriovoraceae bacterium]|nr:response regulator [Halobacteriovoraceae bacterium]